MNKKCTVLIEILDNNDKVIIEKSFNDFTTGDVITNVNIGDVVECCIGQSEVDCVVIGVRPVSINDEFRVGIKLRALTPR